MVPEDETRYKGLTRPPASASVSVHKSMDKDYTKDYPREDGLRGLEKTVPTVESTFHAGCVWTVWVDKVVCDSQYMEEEEGEEGEEESDVVRALLYIHSAWLGM